jgi:hypothetical protein
MRRPKGLQAENARKLMEKGPLLLLGSDRISHCLDNLAVTYVEKRIRDTLEERKSWCWRSWSAAICQIKRQAKKLLKEIKLQNPKRNNAYLKKKVPLYKIRERKKEKKKINTSMETLLGEISKFQ